LFNTFVALLLVVSVPLAGGRLSRLAGIRLRWAPAILGALLLQIVMSEVADHAARALLVAVHLSSYVLIAAALWKNRRLAGLPLLALGAASNVLAISLNDGVMPASARALAAAGMGTDASDFANSDVVAHPVLPWLGDIMATPSWLPFRNVLSVGDILILVGAGVLLHVVCRSRLLPYRRRTPEPSEAPDAAGGPEAGLVPQARPTSDDSTDPVSHADES
jgi:hypothetical protein